jgi:hypothetical protein
MAVLVGAVADAIARNADLQAERSARLDVIRPVLAAHIAPACA